MSFFTVLIILAIILFARWLIRVLNTNQEFYKTIPGPPPLPFFGNIFEVSTTTDILAAMLKFAKQYDGLYKVRLGPFRTAVIASDYKFVECVLSTTKILNKSDDYLNFHPWLGTGLLTSEGLKWKKHRKILTPAFHFQILEQFIEVFEMSGNRLVQKLHSKKGLSSVDIYPLVTLCTLDIICESAMGTSVNAQSDENSEYVQSVKAMCKIIVERSFHILQMFDITFPLTTNYYLQKKSLKVLHDQTNSVISKRREELKFADTASPNVYKMDTSGGTAHGDMSRRKKAFLDLLLQATVDGRPLTHEEIREEVDTFMFEGHDTTASAISFALYSLATNADVQEKAYEEQLKLFGENKDPKITYADLQNMKYLELVIKETLRLFPSVPFYLRKTDQQVEYNGTIIPEGVTISVFAFGIHRDPKYFEDPEKFDPTRFENMDGKFPYAYIPFSAGPRNCIGQKFAMLEMKSTISKILRHFQLHPASPKHELVLASETILKSANGINISISLRN